MEAPTGSIRAWNRAHIGRLIRQRIGSITKEDPESLQNNRLLIEYGLDSRLVAGLIADLSTTLAAPLEAPPRGALLTLGALVEHLVSAQGAAPAPGARSGPASDEPIAVVGMACRFPQAPDLDAYWRLLREGCCARSEVPLDRWDAGRLYHPDPRHPGTAHSRFGYFLDAVDQFEPAFFGVSPREARLMDPQQRLMLELSWEALEDAGQVIDALRGSRTGVFYGLIWNDYGTLLHRLGFDAITQHSVTGSHYSLLSNRVSYVFGLQGPSMSIDAACSTGLVAVHLACQSLRSGESTMALVGGVNLMIAPDSYLVVAKMGTMAPDGLCKAFDARADGFGRGEGGGVVVLKTLSRALRDGDRIYCVIRGSATNNNGSGDRLASPNLSAQQAVLHEAYWNAGVRPDQVAYVEAHGTGTRAGDPVEARALGSVLGMQRSPDRPLLIGSAKSNVGHLEGASGMAGLLKAALSIWHRALPATLHFEAPNPEIPFHDLNVQVVDRMTRLPVGDEPLVMGVNAFGLGGTNCHVVLGEHCPAVPAAPVEVEPELITVSAHSREALSALAQDLGDFLLQHPEVPLRDVAFTRNARRAHLAHRIAVVGRTHQECAERLRARGADRPGHVTMGPRPRAPQRPIVFVFAGQGAQWIGMGEALFEREPVFRAAMEECERAFAPYLTTSLLDSLRQDADPQLLEYPSMIQPLLCAFQIALARLLGSYGVVPAAVIGHSMGEIAAAHIAGALSLADAARIICRRGALIEQYAARGGAMAVVELTQEEAEQEVAPHRGRLAVAAMNAPRTTVLAGDLDVLLDVCNGLEERNIFYRFVKVNVAYHCHHVDGVLSPLREELVGAAPRRGDVPIYSTVLGRSSSGAEYNADYWALNLRRPVRLVDAVQSAIEDGHNIFLELSPHPLLSVGIEQVAEARGRSAWCIPTLRKGEADRRCLLEALGRLYTYGCTIDWASLHPAGGQVRSMPGYRWQRQRCWAEGLSEVTQADAIVTEASRPAIVESLLPARVSGSVIPPWDRSSDGSPAALQSLRDRLGACGPAEREALVRETLRGELAELLLVPADGTIDETPLSHLGIDSMSALRLRARSEQLFGSSPSVAQLLSGASLANVARHICAAMAAREEAPPPASAIGSPERSHTSTYLPQNYASLSDTNAWIAQITDEQVEQELLALLDEQASVA